jgi:hypothetical protein
LISWLLTHEHDSGPGWTLAKDRLVAFFQRPKALLRPQRPAGPQLFGVATRERQEGPCLSDFWTAQTRYCEYFSSRDCLQVRCNY